jgi:4-amino-4-deoxy-L-arabinose transferase-like glycosyltransferase
VIAALAILALRAALLVFSVPAETHFTGDEPYYDEVARGILDRGVYEYKGETSVHRPPGWPFALAMIYKFIGHSRRAVVACQGVFDFGTILGVAWMAGRLFGSRRAAAIGFALAAAWPPFARESRLMQTEPLFTLLVTLLLVRFQAFMARPTVWPAFAVGVCTALASYARPTGIVILAGLGLGWVIQTRGRGLLRVPALIAMAAGVALVLAPWTIRNYRVTGEFLPIAVGSGEQFFLGSLLETEGRWNHDVWWPIRDGAIRDAEAKEGRRLNAIERDHVWMERGLEIWREHPGQSVLITFKRFGRLVALPVVGGHRSLLRLGFLVTLFLLYVLAVPIGVRGLAAGEHPVRFAGALLVMLLFYTAVSSLMYTSSRYFEPVRTALLAMAAGPIARLLPVRRN